MDRLRARRRDASFVQRAENLQAYLLQIQESQSVVAQQMTQIASQFHHLMESSTGEEGGG